MEKDFNSYVSLKEYVDVKIKAVEDSIRLAKDVVDERINNKHSTNNLYFSYFLSIVAILISIYVALIKK